jgi:hypothetical protein
MGRFKDNDATFGLQGNVGKFYNFRQSLGRTIVTRQVVKRRKPLTAHQKKMKRSFLKAVTYAKAVMANPEKSRIYEAKKRPGKGVYLLAITDYLKPPVVDELDITAYTGAIGSKVIVQAMDDFKVARVSVSIFSATGELLEEGDTVLNVENGLDYIYTATTVNYQPDGSRIKAIAYDLAGNTASLEMIL